MKLRTTDRFSRLRPLCLPPTHRLSSFSLMLWLKFYSLVNLVHLFVFHLFHLTTLSHPLSVKRSGTRKSCPRTFVVVVLHSDDAASGSLGVVDDGLGVQGFDGKWVNHADVDSL